MSGISSNARQLRNLYRERARRFAAASRAGLRDVLLAVERKAVENISGAGAPGTFPIPVRDGHLRRSMRTRIVSNTRGIVANTAVHAKAQEDGFFPYGNKHATPIKPRRFLTQASADTPMGEIYRARVVRVLFGPGATA